MSSAEATLQIRTKVGLPSPTMLQSLLILSKLYDSNDTDKPEWVRAIESHPRVFDYYLTTVNATAIEQWADEIEKDILRSITLPFLNFPDHNLEAPSEEADVYLAEALAKLVAPELQRRAGICARLLNTDIETGEADIAHALEYAHHAPELLHDTPLLTRIVAVANHVASERSDTDACAELLKIEREALEAIKPAFNAVPAQNHDKEIEQFRRQLAVINFKAALDKTEVPAVALSNLARLIFGCSRIEIFLQHDDGWRNGSITLQSGRSIIEAAAISGRVESSENSSVTAVDENLMTSLSTQAISAIPVCMTTSPESCAAIAVIGTQSTALDAGAVSLFQATACFLLANPQVHAISLDELEARTRELIHEANNPLSTVQNYLKVLSLKLGDAHEAQPTIDAISTELYRTAGIVERFRQLEDEGSIDDHHAEVNAILRQQSDLFRQSAGTVDFMLKLDDRAPCAAINSQSLKQVVMNLIKNAVEAMNGRGNIVLESRGALRQGDDLWVEISISDNGPGIDPSLGDVLRSGVTGKTGEHRGQGLNIASTLINKAGGYISYRSEPGLTEFRLTVPQIQQYEQ